MIVAVMKSKDFYKVYLNIKMKITLDQYQKNKKMHNKQITITVDSFLTFIQNVYYQDTQQTLILIHSKIYVQKCFFFC